MKEKGQEIKPGQVLVAKKIDHIEEGTSGELHLEVQIVTPGGNLVVSPLYDRWGRKKRPIILGPEVLSTGEVVDGGRVGKFKFPSDKNQENV